MVVFEKEKDFLSNSFITQANEILQLEAPVLDALIKAAELIRSNAGLWQLALVCRNRVINTDQEELAAAIPDLLKIMEQNEVFVNSAMGKQSGMFAAVIVTLILPWTIRYYRLKRIPQNVLLDTMSDLAIWTNHYYDEHGVWGLGNIDWIFNHLSGKLFRLGRLQFIYTAFQQPIVVFQNIHNREIAAFPEAGIDYRQDGLIDGTNGVYDNKHKWTSQYHETTDSFSGNPLLPSGIARNETVHLRKIDWRIKLQRGDSVLDIHIPEGSKMDHEQCKASLLQAVTFYKTHFPQQSFAAFACTSWLLDPQLQVILPPAANLVKFQKEFQLFPVLSDDGETYQRVFGSRIIDPAAARRDTALQRAILDYVKAGHQLHAASGFILC